MIRLVSDRKNYSSQKNLIAKKSTINFVGRNNQMGKIIYSNLVEKLSAVLELELESKYVEASELLKPHWQGFGHPVNTIGLAKEEKAELLLRVGSVITAFGESQQVENAQEAARALLGEAERLFFEIKNPDRAAMCGSKAGASYWRAGEFICARIVLRDALRFAETDETKYHILGNLALNERSDGNYLEAIPIYEEIIKAENVSVHVKANARNGINTARRRVLEKTNDPAARERLIDSIVMDYQQNLIVYHKINKTLEASTRNNFGYFLMSLGRYVDALEQFETAKTQHYRDQDDLLISTVSDSLSVLYRKVGNPAEACANSRTALKHVTKEKTANRWIFTVNYAINLAQNGEIVKSKTYFDDAIGICLYLQDAKLKAKTEIFYLLELFDTVNKADRLKIYTNAATILAKSQEKDITDCLEEIKQKLDSGVVVEKEPIKLLEAIDLDAEMFKLRGERIGEMLKAVGGNATEAAKMLGITRGRLDYEIRNHYPHLTDEKNAVGRPFGKTPQFANYTVFLNEKLKQFRIARIHISRNFSMLKRGDLLLVAKGIYEIDKIVLINANNEMHVGFLNISSDRYVLDTGREVLNIQSVNSIVGQGVAYIKAKDYETYVETRKKGGNELLPLIEIE